MECRKDLTFFKNTFDLGGMWKHNFKSEDRLLGVRYNNSGYNTFYPYKLLLPNHWLLEGVSLPNDSLFGNFGIDSLGITHYDSTWGVRENGQQELALTAYIVPLIKAVQELSAKNAELEEKLNIREGELEQRVHDLEQRLV